MGCIAALWLVVLTLHLTPGLFAGLLTFAATRTLAGRLERLRPGLAHAHAWALTLLLVVGTAAAAVVIERTAEAAAAGSGYAGLLQQMASALEQLRVLCPRGSRHTCRCRKSAACCERCAAALAHRHDHVMTKVPRQR